jgi:hypothetical protein
MSRMATNNMFKYYWIYLLRWFHWAWDQLSFSSVCMFLKAKIVDVEQESELYAIPIALVKHLETSWLDQGMKLYVNCKIGWLEHFRSDGILLSRWFRSQDCCPLAKLGEGYPVIWDQRGITLERGSGPEFQSWETRKSISQISFFHREQITSRMEQAGGMIHINTQYKPIPRFASFWVWYNEWQMAIWTVLRGRSEDNR